MKIIAKCGTKTPNWMPLIKNLFRNGHLICISFTYQWHIIFISPLKTGQFDRSKQNENNNIFTVKVKSAAKMPEKIPNVGIERC